MMKKALSLLVVLAFAAMLSLVGVHAAADSVKLVVADAVAGENTTVVVEVKGVTGLVGSLTWDADVLEYVGAAFASGVSGALDKDTGNFALGSAMAVDGAIATITFKALEEGSADVSLEITEAVDDDINDITDVMGKTFEDTVVVSEPVVSEPIVSEPVVSEPGTSEVPVVSGDESEDASAAASTDASAAASSDPGSPKTGDAGVVAFAALALIAGAATVVIAKKTSK